MTVRYPHVSNGSQWERDVKYKKPKKKTGTLQGVSLQCLRIRKHWHRALRTSELYSRLRRGRRGRRLKGRSTLHQSRRDGNKEMQFPHIRVRTAVGMSVFLFLLLIVQSVLTLLRLDGFHSNSLRSAVPSRSRRLTKKSQE